MTTPTDANSLIVFWDEDDVIIHLDHGDADRGLQIPKDELSNWAKVLLNFLHDDADEANVIGRFITFDNKP